VKKEKKKKKNPPAHTHKYTEYGEGQHSHHYWNTSSIFQGLKSLHTNIYLPPCVSVCQLLLYTSPSTYLLPR